MTFYIDADSFPASAREVIIRAAIRRNIMAVFVARRNPGLPKNPLIRFEAAPEGSDAADDIIARLVQPGDLSFTHDVPLAARLVESGVLVINDRGMVYTTENIRARLSERNFMAALRNDNLIPSAGMGGKPYGQRELQEFSNAFDRELTRLLKI